MLIRLKKNLTMCKHLYNLTSYDFIFRLAWLSTYTHVPVLYVCTPFCRASKAVPVALAGFASMALLALVCFRKRLPKPCQGKEPYDTDSDSEPELEEKEKGEIPTVMAYKVEPVDSPSPSDPKHSKVVCVPDKKGSVETSFRICNSHSL